MSKKEEQNIMQKDQHIQDIEKEDILQNDILLLIKQDSFENIIEKFNDLHPSDSIKILENIDIEQRRTLLNLFPKSFYIDIIEWLPDFLIQELINVKGIDFIVSIIQENKDIDLTYFIVKDLDEESKNKVLEAVSIYRRKATEKKFNYPKDSAGRLMQSSFVRVLETWNVSQCINYIKELEKNSPQDEDDYFYDVFIVDDKGVAKGVVSLAKLLTTKEDIKIDDIKNDNFKTIYTHLDQEEVALIFRNRGFVSAGVVDESGVLVGAITIDDIIDVIYQETQEDLLLMSGIQTESRRGRYRTIFNSAQRRLKWLSFNFIEALAIPFIVTIYGKVLSDHVIIAALIQFVVALGGNAGMQSLSVTLRGITLKLITKSNVYKQVGKEFSIAFLNGVILGTIGFIWGSFWGDGQSNITIGIIAFLAVFVNVILGTTFGTMYPIILKRLRIDPAVASSVCVTTSTDIVGFFLVLLIATLLL